MLARYAMIYFVLIRNCFRAQMQYRSNFYAGIIVEIGYLLAKLMYAVVVYKTGVHINGLAPNMILMFIGTYVLMTGIYMGIFFVNFITIPSMVRDGTLDCYFTKPISLQFIVSLRYLDFGMPIPNIIGGIVMIAIGWHNIQLPVTLFNIIGFIWFIGCGVVLNYAIFLIPITLSFWTVKTNGIFEISNSLWDFNNMPMGIYDKWLQRIGIFVIPLFLISNFSPLFALGKLSLLLIIWGSVAPIVFLVLSRIFWKLGIAHYNSASS